MENNSEVPNGKRKNLLLYILFTLLVFAPTVLIIVILLIQGAHGADRQGAADGESVAESLPSGEETRPSYLCLTEGSVPIASLPDGHSEMRRITAESGEDRYTFYFSADGGRAYYTLNGSSVYAVGAVALESFMPSEAAEDIKAPRPMLYHNGEAVHPLSEELGYTKKDGTFATLPRLYPDATESVRAENQRIYLCFDAQPDECTVTLYDGEKRVFTGSPQELIRESFEGYDALYCHVYARWREREGAVCGYANYGFAVRFDASGGDSAAETERERVECFLDTEELSAGEYAVLTVKGADASEGVLITASPSLPYEIKPFLLDGDIVSFIPVPCDASAGEILLSVTVGESEHSLSLHVTERAYKEREYDASDILIRLSRSEEALLEYERIRSVINGIPSGGAPSTDPVSEKVSRVFSDGSIYLGFGYYRRLCDGTRYLMDGVDYRLPDGTEIPAVLSGTVLYSGYSCYLGNFVILDHGAGVRTWYAHLSSVSVTEGEAVRSGDTLGESGRSGFTTTKGAYLICTVNGVCVSPYSLIECGAFKDAR